MEYPKFNLLEMLKEISDDETLVARDQKRLLSQKEIQRLLIKKRKKSIKHYGDLE